MGRRLLRLGSQKGFMLPTGLGILAVSQKALDANKTQNGRMNRCFFSWEDMIKTNDLGYFPYTPATQLIRGLRASLDLIFAEGLDTSSLAITVWRQAFVTPSMRGASSMRGA